MYTLFLAWRYVRGRLLNLVAVGAIALALTVQIVVMAVLDGMLVDAERRVRDIGEQITLYWRPAEEGARYPTRAEVDRAAAAAADVPGVRGATPLILTYALATRTGHYAPVQIRGIDLAEELRFSELPNHLLEWTPDPAAPSWYRDPAEAHPLPPAFLSREVAERLDAVPGDEIQVAVYHDPEARDPVRRRFVVTNLFRSGSPFVDELGVFVPITAAQELLFGEGAPSVERLSVWLEDPQRAEALAPVVGEVVMAAVGPLPGTETWRYTWMDYWESWYRGMVHENALQEIVLALITVSGGFCVFAVLATLVSRRARDVGLLRALGAGRGSMCALFLLVGLLMGLLGSALGVAGGYYCTPRVDDWYEFLAGHPLYPPRLFGIEELTTVIYPWKVALYAAGATAVSVLAALYPALWAAWREPLEALRDE
jgi:lipoprotein-releasing system permease protein